MQGLRCQTFEVRPYWKRESGYVALRQAAKDAATDLTALVVASHPDDRHVMPTAYLRFARGWRVTTLLMTRGEGGQNSKGPEIGDELGWRRTLESEACGSLVDSRVWYLNRQDAGFTRSSVETLELWGRQDSIESMARVIRATRPDVVLTTHGPDEVHGHDLALLEILPEAVRLARDPEFVSEGHGPWKVRKVFRGPGAAEMDAVRDALPMDEMDRVRGETYRRLAYTALKQHESQEPIRPIDELFASSVLLYPGMQEDLADANAWTLVDGLPSLFDGLPDTWDTRFLRRDLDDLVDEIGSPGTLVRFAVSLYGRLSRLDVSPGSDLKARRDRRLEALGRVILHGSGFVVSAEVPRGAVAVAGRRFPIRVRVHNGGGPIFRQLRIEMLDGAPLQLDPEKSELLDRLPPAEAFTVDAEGLSSAAALDRRKWLETIFAASTFAPPIRLRCTVRVEPEEEPPFDLQFPVVVPADVHAPVELEVFPKALVLGRDNNVGTLTVNVTRNTEDRVDSKLEVLGQAGFVIDPSPVDADMGIARYRDYQFEVRVPESLRPGVYNLHVLLGDMRHIVPVHKIDVALPKNLSVGLVRGVDETAQHLLQAYFGRCEVLDAEALSSQSFAHLDTIVVDIRALRERPGATTWKAARAAFPRFLEFVREGGRLVVFYHKDTEFNAATAGFVGAPYPLHIGKSRVTREDAPVEVLDGEHRLLTHPNEIHPQDWDGWVQERGLYFPDEYAPEYEELIAMADAGETKSRSSLLYARYGEGDYIYCALSLYRQLDTLHPGACRIFANLVSR